MHDPVDGPVVLRQGEQIGDADEDDEQRRGEAVEHVAALDLEDVEADDEGRDERQGSHVDAAQGGDEEDQDENEE